MRIDERREVVHVVAVYQSPRAVLTHFVQFRNIVLLRRLPRERMEPVEHLREQVVSQQAHVEDLTAQLQDLRALVTSQQQVLMYLGKDMDVTQPPAVELSLVPPRVPPYREKKSPRDRRDTAVEAPYLNA